MLTLFIGIFVMEKFKERNLHWLEEGRYYFYMKLYGKCQVQKDCGWWRMRTSSE